MKVLDLKKIYKEAVVSNNKLDSKDYYTYYDGKDYLNIKISSLKSSEISLLDSINKNYSLKSDYYNLLINNVNNVKAKGPFLCVHFYVDNLINNEDQWLNSFKSFFTNIYDGFFINKNQGVVILSNFTKQIEQLEGFIHMLDDDFSSKTSVFVGVQTNYTSLYNIYKEESKLFLSNKRSGQVLSFNDVFIPSYVKSSLSKSPIASQLRNVLNNDKDLSDMIKSLWKHQGNMTAAAQDLYIHRNTINYRLDRLNSEYNLNLRNMQELLLCYLLVI